MANFPYIEKYPNRVVDVVKMHHRMGPYPDDPSTVFNTKAEADAYVSNSKSYAYPGQIIAVANGDINSMDDTDYSVYVVRSDRTLQLIQTNNSFTNVGDIIEYLLDNPGSIPSGTTYSLKENGVYKLYAVTSNNTVEEVLYTSGTTSWDSITNKPTTLEDLGITDIASAEDIVTLQDLEHYHYCESTFYTDVVSTSLMNTFDYSLVEKFVDTSFIDKTTLDGANICTTCHNSDCHILKKTDTSVKSFKSVGFTFNSEVTSVWSYVDYEGTGTVDVYITKDNGVTETKLNNKNTTSIAIPANTTIKLRFVMTGVVTLCNFALGVL